LRWSWVHWWEANRSLYLNPTSQSGSPQSASQEALASLRAQATADLILMLDDPDEEPRAAAALALGRLRHSEDIESVKALAVIAQNDTLEYIRARAVLAIGMIGGKDAKSFLLAYNPPSQRLRASTMLSMGLLRQPSARVMERLVNGLNQGETATRNAAWWALSQHPDSALLEHSSEIIQTSRSPWLVSGALLALRLTASEAGDRVLGMALLNDDTIQNLPVWKLLSQVTRDKPKTIALIVRGGSVPMPGGGQQVDQRLRNRWITHHKRVFAHEPTPVPVGASPPDYKRVRSVTGIEAIYRSRLRSSAAIALAGAQDRELAVEVLARLILEQDNDYNTVPKCFALISLAQISSPKSLEVLLHVATDKDGRRSKRQKDLESPLRGFAMIGLGLYARSEHTEQGSYDRPGYERALEMLQEILADKREKLEARAAAAVALGLSGRTANLKLLIGGYEAFDDTNPLLGGYVLLGRALLGDINVIEPARASLDRKPHHDKTTDLLARRAAVLALGVAGTNEAIPHLIWAWDQPFYVNREVIFALSLCDAPGVSVHLLPRLAGDGNRYERAFMAEAVGRLLNQDTLPPLSTFLIGSNFTMKNGLLDPIRFLENQFMYDYLIPQFQEVWY
jgi:HEAT repeat protein